jgi:hypothetical protein
MTTTEFSNQFDIHYNSIAGMSAPGLDLFEKSVFLTKAQLELIKDYYDPASNRKQKGFEASEKRRVDLKELIKPYKSSTSFTDVLKSIHNSSRFFPIPDETFLIINESVGITSTDCNNGLSINVKPITHDEFNIQIRNPFKTPDTKIAWRLDISKISDEKVVEIVSPYNITSTLEYRMRYLKYPKPIILGDLDTLFPGEDLSIDGQNTESTSELDEGIHPEILDRAVEIALRDYKPQGLESKIQMDLRNE